MLSISNHQCPVIDEDTIAFGSPFRLPAKRDLDWPWDFVPGSYRLEAVATSGHRGALEFDIADGDTVQGTLELQIR